jgi:hypothetical protein
MCKEAMVWMNSCGPLKDRKQTTTQGPKPSILGLGYKYDKLTTWLNRVYSFFVGLTFVPSTQY